MADLLDAAEDDAGAEVPAAAGSEAFKPHGGQQHRVEGRGDGRRASRGQVSQPRPAREQVAEEDLTEEAAPSLSSASAPRGPP